MFYNGTKTFNNLFCYCLLTWLFTINSVTFKLFLVYTKTGFNESLLLLNLISSNIYTYFVLVWYIYSLLQIIKVSNYYNLLIVVSLSFFYFVDSNNNCANILNIFKTININTNLQNGLVNIHPYFIYILYGWIIVLLGCLYIIDKHAAKNFSYLQKYAQYTTIVLIGIFLGAWWAAQEFNWGGYWSWDPVEVLSLLILILLLWFLHTQDLNIRHPKLIVAFIYIFLIYCVMRLGVVNTIHSFIRSINLPYYVFILTGVILIYMATFIIKGIWYIFTVRVYRAYKRIYIIMQIILGFLTAALISLISMNLNLITTSLYLMMDKFYLIFTLLCISYYIGNIHLAQKYCMNYIFFFSSLLLLFIYGKLITIIVFYVCFVAFIAPNLHRYIHIVLCWLYFLFVLFFVKLKMYAIDIFNLELRAQLNYFSFNKGCGSLYEINFFEVKKTYLYNIKSLHQHIFGFNVVTTCSTTLFIFNKIPTYKIMFGEEFLMFTLFLSLIFFFFNFFKIYKNKVEYY